MDDYDVITLFIVPDLSKFRLFLANTYDGHIGWVNGTDVLTASIDTICDVNYTFGLSYIYDSKMYLEDIDGGNIPSLAYLGHEVQAQTAVPTSDVPSGEVTSGAQVHFSSSDTGAKIYYAVVDNSTFQSYNPEYPPEITGDCTVRVVAKSPNKLVSEELILTFTVA